MIGIFIYCRGHAKVYYFITYVDQETRLCHELLFNFFTTSHIVSLSQRVGLNFVMQHLKVKIRHVHK